MIVGLGLYVVEVPRIERMTARWGDRFINKIYTANEREYSLARANTAQHLAARFAAKEATLKALGVPRGCSWHEMEVVGGGGVAPRLVLTGTAKRAADALGITSVHLRLTHTRDIAAAVVVAET